MANICIVESRKMSSYNGPVPKPDPGQPYNKYYWVKSAMEKLQSRCPNESKGDVDDCSPNPCLNDGKCTDFVNSFTCTCTGDYKGDTCSSICPKEVEIPLGMASGYILDGDIIASSILSAYVASGARLNNPGIWCGGVSDSTPWMRVNFNAKVYITGLITQGWVNEDFYVKTFYIKYGDISSSLTYVTTSGGNMQLFSGNSDDSTQVTNWFSSALHAQYLQIDPVSWEPNGYPCCMKLEVLGCR
ncbi:EGF-like repeat and discoidin I-like domain-containing protein 3 [Asterias amurensis]|uniref:EGF-like repeat and discoidin I-like domain-containing protein 3 n=1 Tax=Asterias amurensis TaxID=7602 RepID=UPI003AB4C5E6